MNDKSNFPLAELWPPSAFLLYIVIHCVSLNNFYIAFSIMNLGKKQLRSLCGVFRAGEFCSELADTPRNILYNWKLVHVGSRRDRLAYEASSVLVMHSELYSSYSDHKIEENG